MRVEIRKAGEKSRVKMTSPELRSSHNRTSWEVAQVISLLCYERFSPGYSGFPLSSKTNI